MAVSTSSYFSNSIIGVPQVGADIDIYETSSSPKYALGFGFTRADGNKYRYAHFGALSNRGTLVAVDVSESGATKIENIGAVLANRSTQDNILSNAIDSRYLQLVITATADQFAGGYITITTGAGSGFTYRIKGNTATSANNPVTGNVLVELHDKVVVAIDSNSDIVIAGCPYANLEGITTTDQVPAGVTVTNNTAASYGWIQTTGMIGVLQDITIGTIGRNVTVSSNTTGAVSAINSSTSPTALNLQPLVGYIVEAGSSADYSIIYLTLE